jgi:hypothetical protein
LRAVLAVALLLVVTVGNTTLATTDRTAVG